jgi:hypothetical protein
MSAVVADVGYYYRCRLLSPMSAIIADFRLLSQALAIVADVGCCRAA